MLSLVKLKHFLCFYWGVSREKVALSFDIKQHTQQ